MQRACLAAASYVLRLRPRQALGVAPLARGRHVTASATLIAPLALLVDRPWTLLDLARRRRGLLLAALSTALAYLIYRLLASAGARISCSSPS